MKVFLVEKLNGYSDAIYIYIYIVKVTKANVYTFTINVYPGNIKIKSTNRGVVYYLYF